MIPCYKRCRRHLQRVVEVGSTSWGIAYDRARCWHECEDRNGEFFPKWGHRNGKLGGFYKRYSESRRLRNLRSVASTSDSEFVNQLPPNLSDEMIPCYKRCRRHLQRVVEVGSTSWGIAYDRARCWHECEDRNGEFFPKWGHRNGKLGGFYKRYSESRRLRKHTCSIVKKWGMKCKECHAQRCNNKGRCSRSPGVICCGKDFKTCMRV